MKMSDHAGAPVSEVNQPTPHVGGWLLYFCVSLTILGPAAMAGWIQKTPSPLLAAVYVSLALSSFVAGLTTWAKMSSAFLWLKIALVTRLLYAIFQSYLATKAARGPSPNSDFVKTRAYKRDRQYISDFGVVFLFPLLLARSGDLRPKYLDRNEKI
jgi:hypothetical protein